MSHLWTSRPTLIWIILSFTAFFRTAWLRRWLPWRSWCFFWLRAFRCWFSWRCNAEAFLLYRHMRFIFFVCFQVVNLRSQTLLSRALWLGCLSRDNTQLFIYLIIHLSFLADRILKLQQTFLVYVWFFDLLFPFLKLTLVSFSYMLLSLFQSLQGFTVIIVLVFSFLSFYVFVVVVFIIILFCQNLAFIDVILDLVA